MSDDAITLSATGAARKDAIFGTLVAAQKQRRNRRLAVQSSAGTLAVLAAGIAGWAALRAGASGAAPSPPIAHVDDPNPSPGADSAGDPDRAVTIVTVHNDPSVLARYTARSDSDPATIIGDDELDDLLTRAGRPAGFIRTPGRFLLASDVHQPALPPPGSG